MPDYEVTDPKRGISLTVTGPAPPSEAVLDRLFHDAAMKTAHIGPTPEDAPVTLGDLIDNPAGAIKRMVTITKNAVTDPKVMIPAAIGLGIGALSRAADVSPSMPKMPDVRGMVTRTAGKMTKGLDPEVAADAVGVLSPRAGNAIRTASRLGKVLTKQTPPEAAPTPSPTSGTAPATAPTPAAVTTPAAPPPKVAAPVTAETDAPAASGMPSLEDLQLTKAEIETAVKWHEQGVKPEMILHRILQSRQLTARTRTTTPDQAAEAIRRRNATGKWED
jgi:hypothetical protein